MKPGSSFRAAALAAFFTCLVLAGLIYSNTWRHEFVWDDAYVLSESRFYKEPSNIIQLFSPAHLTSNHRIAYASRMNIGSGELSFRPLASLSYFGYRALFGDYRPAYRAASVLLHAVGAFILFLLTFRLFGRLPLAWAVAVLFTAHPIQAEVVNQITFNENTLMFIFAGLSLLMCLGSSDETRPGGWRMLAGSLFYLAACFSKESAVLLPLLILAHDRTLKKTSSGAISRRRFFWICFVLSGVFYLAVRLLWMKNTGGEIAYPGGTVWTLAKSLVQGPLWVFLPHQVHPTIPADSQWIVTSCGQAGFILPAALAALVSAAAFLLRKRYPGVLFSWSWFLIWMLPASSVLFNYSAPRFFYAAAVPLYWFAAWLWDKIFREGFLKRARYYALGLTVFFLSFTTFCQNLFWTSNDAFFRQMAANYPEHYFAHYQSGYAQLKYGDVYGAIGEFRVSRMLAPGWPKPDAAIASAMAEVRQYEPALYFMEGSLKRFPTDGFGWIVKGRLLSAMGRYNEASDAYKQALAVSPSQIEAYDELAGLSMIQGKRDEAKQYLEQSLARYPTYGPSLDKMRALQEQAKQ